MVDLSSDSLGKTVILNFVGGGFDAAGTGRGKDGADIAEGTLYGSARLTAVAGTGTLPKAWPVETGPVGAGTLDC